MIYGIDMNDYRLLTHEDWHRIEAKDRAEVALMREGEVLADELIGDSLPLSFTKIDRQFIKAESRQYENAAIQIHCRPDSECGWRCEIHYRNHIWVMGDWDLSGNKIKARND
jgi:hypothetical protein